MAAIKVPCFDYQAATAGKEKNFGLTAEDIRPLWRYARQRYLDHGMSFEDAVNALSKETGAPARFWEEVFKGGKTPIRGKTKEMFIAEDNRRNAIWEAQKTIERADLSGVEKFLRTAGDLPRATLTAFHGGVFPVTHAGGLLLRPTAWGDFFRGAALSWKFASIGPIGRAHAQRAYEEARLHLQDSPRYADWRNAGLRIGTDERAQGILSGWMANTPGWSNRSWLGVMQIRYNLAEHMLRQTSSKLMQNPADRADVMKKIAEIANHSTGVTNIQVFGKYLSKGLFAPQLTASKLVRATHDPYETVKTAYKMMTGRGGEVTAGDRAAMYLRTRNATEFLATTAAGLYLNNEMLKYFGSDQRINFTNPKKSDFWRFKSGAGDVFSSRGPEEYLRLFGQLIAVGYAGNRELHGKDPLSAAMDAITRFGLYKMAPGLLTAVELGYGADLFGRPLPRQYQQLRGAVGIPERMAKPGKPAYTIFEYLWSHAPIFLDGPARDVYDDMRARGMSEPDARAMVHAAVLTALEFTGLGAYHEQPPTAPAKKGKPYKGAIQH